MAEGVLVEDHTVGREEDLTPIAGLVGVGAPNPPSKPDKEEEPRLTMEEKLTLENLALKAENLRLQQERIKQDFVSATRMLLELRKEAEDYQSSLNRKYGVTLAKCKIQPDGSIVPPPLTAVPAAMNGG
jgi:hypothetical protein